MPRLSGPRAFVGRLTARPVAITAGVAAVAVLALAPSVLTSFYLFLLTLALVYAIFAISVDLQWGYAGLINFGAAGPFGLGAYTYGMLTPIGPFTSAYVVLPAAMLVGGLYGLAVAYPAFRARTLPLYYALLTLAGALLLQKLATVSDATGGFNGINGVSVLDMSVPGILPDAQIVSSGATYALVVTVLLTVLFMARWITATPAGRVVRALREDEMRCESLGYPVLRYKLAVASGSAALSALAGGLFAAVNGNITPALFGVQLSLLAFIWVALGGAGTLIGPALAAVSLSLAEGYFSRASGELYLVVISGLFILGVVFLPRGLAGLLHAAPVTAARLRTSRPTAASAGKGR